MTWPKGTNGPAKGPGRGGPANGSWRQFQPTHGARSDRTVSPVAEALKQEALTNRPDLAEPRNAATFEAWAYWEARCRLYRAYADQLPVVNPETGEPWPFEAAHRTAESKAENLRRELGIGPLSEAKLITARAEAAITAGDFELIVGPGRELLEARERRLRLERGGDQTDDRAG